MQPQDQIKEILIFLGRENDLEGQLRDKHITKILEYMITQNSEDYAKTISKLAFKCGISARIIRENYLLGMEMFDIISTYTNGGAKHWKWQGAPQTRVDGILIAVKNQLMCDNCGMKRATKDCIQVGCKNIKQHEKTKTEKVSE